MLTFADGDSLRLNQSGAETATSRPSTPRTPVDDSEAARTRISRMRMITYYLDNDTDPEHPRLVRRVNNGDPGTFDNTLGTAVAIDAVDLQFTYDISNGTGNPGGVEMNGDDLSTGGACSPAACAETQIRKVNVQAQSRVAERGQDTASSPTRSNRRSACGRWRSSIGTDKNPDRDLSRSEAVMKTSLTKNESGMALVTAILVLMLASGLMAGMFAALLANQRSHATDRDQSVAYAAAHAGLEKLTAGLAALFATDFSPSAAQLAIVDNTPPTIPASRTRRREASPAPATRSRFTPDPGPGAQHRQSAGLSEHRHHDRAVRRIQGPDHAVHAHRDRAVGDG